MPLIDREQIGNEIAWSSTRYKTMLGSPSRQEAVDSHAELLATHFWQTLATETNSDNLQSLFDEFVTSWNTHCIEHAADIPAPDFTYPDNIVKDMESKLAIDPVSYDAIRTQVITDREAAEQAKIDEQARIAEMMKQPVLTDEERAKQEADKKHQEELAVKEADLADKAAGLDRKAADDKGHSHGNKPNRR